MASYCKMYETALEKWHRLKNAQKFSVSDSEGVTAVIAANPYSKSYAKFYLRRIERLYAAKDLEEYNHEASELAIRLGQVGISTAVYYSATAEDLVEAIVDPNISSVITIGHGTLNHVEISDRKNFDWREASRLSNHLKLGSIVQRTCGVTPRSFNVPFGLFLVADSTKVLAAHDAIFTPTSLDDPINRLIQPVLSTDHPPLFEQMAKGDCFRTSR